MRFRLARPLAADLPARIFAVRTHAAGGELSHWSNLAGARCRACRRRHRCEFPATATKEGVELAWSRVATAGGAGRAGYHVYRREAARTSYGEPIATLDAAASTTSRQRRHLRPALHLRVCGDRRSRRRLVGERASGEREIDYQDRFAPLPPAELCARWAASARCASLWEASPDPDVAGYVVERADPERSSTA